MTGRATVPVSDADLEVAARIASHGADPSAQAVFLRDKQLMFNDARTAFIMYGTIRCSWISAGDPIGDASEFPALIARFATEARADSSYASFYKVGRDVLESYLDNDFIVGKIGETARIPASGFTLDGASRRRLRRSVKSAAGSGLLFEVIEGESLHAALPALKHVSDGWLREKRSREKGFSLGNFQRDYISRFPVAVVTMGSAPVAFASLWKSSDGGEIEIDLMRFSGDAPAGTMHYLIVELVAWADANGYGFVGLGMAPLAGATWFPRFMHKRMQKYYNFEGLREFKQTFDPEWSPRYLATSPGITRTVAGAHVAALTSGGVSGIFRK